MSKILDLAKNFEQTSSKQAKDTEQVVATEFKKHEQRLIDLLSENEKAISNAIQEQNKRLLPTMLKTWSIVAIAIVTALLLMWGILTYQSKKIAQNAEIMAQQEIAIQELANKGGNVKLQDCIDDKNRKRLCVLVNKDAGSWGKGSLMVPMGY
ncbi:MbeB family mobilization protein [Acinetobacter sp. YH18001]|uniref:MbeB family mobilization protein n=1 Tax=Acinetobacter sp. YH18001 TaxID=2601197 RepID=UPI00359FE15F